MGFGTVEINLVSLLNSRITLTCNYIIVNGLSEQKPTAMPLFMLYYRAAFVARIFG